MISWLVPLFLFSQALLLCTFNSPAFVSLFWYFRQRLFLCKEPHKWNHSLRKVSIYYCNSNKNRTVKFENDTVQCKDVIIFFSSRKEAPDVPYNLTVINSRNKTTTVNYVPDTLSNLYGWMVLLLDKETYTLAFDNPLLSKQLQVTWELLFLI